MEVPIHVSNVALCDKDNNVLKVKVRQDKKGRELVYKAGNKESLYRPVKKPA
jgi:ribosomal protein L24